MRSEAEDSVDLLDQTRSWGDKSMSGSRPWNGMVFVLVLLYFSNIPVHGFLYGGWPVQPAMIFGGILFLIGPLVYARGGLAFFESPLALWCVAFVALTVGWFVIFGGDNLPSVLGRCYAAIFLLFFYTLLSLDAATVRVARMALATGVLLGAVCNVYEVFNTTAFLPPGFFFGRSAGFYINPNQSGAALVLGTILGVGVIRPQFRWFFLAMGLGGIFLTLSRSAILGWAVGIMVLYLTGALRLRSIMMGLTSVVIAALAAWQLLAAYLLESRGINLDLLLERVNFFTQFNSVPDMSQMERARVAEKAWQLFDDNALLGRGLGATETWSDSASTHNMYLYFMSDYGIAGALLYPLLVYAVIQRAPRAVRPPVLAFALFAIVWGVFSHNIAGELYSLMCFATVAALSHTALRSASRRPGMESGPIRLGVNS